MLRYRLTELMSDKQFRERKRVTILDVANATGINRMTISKMINHPGYNTVTDNLDKLCTYFGCAIGDLVEHVADEEGATKQG